MILMRITINKPEPNHEMQGWSHYERFTTITIFWPTV